MSKALLGIGIVLVLATTSWAINVYQAQGTVDMYNVQIHDPVNHANGFLGVINMWQGNVFDTFVIPDRNGNPGTSFGSLDGAVFDGGVQVINNQLVVTNHFGYTYYDADASQNVSFEITVTPTVDTVTLTGPGSLSFTLPGGSLPIATYASTGNGPIFGDSQLALPWPGDNPAGLAGLTIGPYNPGNGGGPTNPEPSTMVLMLLGAITFYLARKRK